MTDSHGFNKLLSDSGVLDGAPRAITIGNFDGVHRGHQMILAAVAKRAAAAGLRCTALTFEPHPVSVFRKLPAESFRLTSTRERRELLLQFGADEVVTIPFSRAFAELPPEAFVHSLLIERLHAAELHVGYDFAFGKGRSGTTRMLQKLALERDVSVIVHDALSDEEDPVSSTRVRAAVRVGDMDAAERLLGFPWFLSGHQERGHQRGRKMGVPTVNLYPAGRLLPPNGVYATTLRIGDETFPGVSNLGIRPTFGDDERVSAETFVLGDFPDRDELGEIRVEFLRYLRPERSFDSVDGLTEQIGRDVAAAKAIHDAR